jgi:hypothetical protein
MPRGQDLDLKRRYRRQRTFVGGHGLRRRRGSVRPELVPLVVFALALLVVCVTGSLQGARQRVQQPAGVSAPAHP